MVVDLTESDCDEQQITSTVSNTDSNTSQSPNIDTTHTVTSSSPTETPTGDDVTVPDTLPAWTQPPVSDNSVSVPSQHSRGFTVTDTRRCSQPNETISCSRVSFGWCHQVQCNPGLEVSLYN